MNTPIERKIEALAKSYVPEWSYSKENPDSGTALAILISEMLSISESRLEKVLHKHKLQYLNMFDRIMDEPVESAKSYIKFTPVDGIAEPVFVPKGTELFADVNSERITFETTHGITAVNSKLAVVYSTDAQSDSIVKLGPVDVKKPLDEFAAFGIEGENLAKHSFVMAFDDVFDYAQGVDFSLKITTVDPEDVADVLTALTADTLKFSIADPVEGEIELTDVKVENGLIHIVHPELVPQKVMHGGEMRYVLTLKSEHTLDVEITSVSLLMQAKELLPDEVKNGGVTQNIAHFSPFGEPLELYSSSVLENKQALSKKGAKITLNFDLGFNVYEVLMPELLQSEEFKLIMKRENESAKLAVLDVHADYAIFEYLSPQGWKRLIQDEHMAMLFNGSAGDKVEVTFTCPHDIMSYEDAGADGRLRIRLLKADGVYKMPVRQHCPVIDNLTFSYTYTDSGKAVNVATTENSFDVKDVTPMFARSRSTKLFYSNLSQNPTMYLGFEGNPTGTPFSLYFDIENRTDYPVDLTVEYQSTDGFVPIKVMDNTSGLLYSGTMMMIVPKDIVKSTMFGEEYHWIRLVCHNKEVVRYKLPIIKGVYENMARVENLQTLSQTFFLQDVDAELRIQLESGNLISADVFVCEEGPVQPNWVKWEKKLSMSDIGRVYDIDLVAGTLHFAKSVFSRFPLDSLNPAIRVDYRVYHGARANVPAKAITSLARSVRYVRAVENPLPAYGGYDGFSEESTYKLISGLLRTRGRAVTEKDYFDVIRQATYGVRRIKCANGMDSAGNIADDKVTIAVLIEDFDRGSHIFSAIKDSIRTYLLDRSTIVPLGKQLQLTQPYFVKLSVRMWIETEEMESAYDLQSGTVDTIREFIDPLNGGFDGKGWEIGVLPTSRQLLAFMKAKYPTLAVTRLMLTADLGDGEHSVDDDIYKKVKNPFALAVNDEHIVYVSLAM